MVGPTLRAGLLAGLLLGIAASVRAGPLCEATVQVEPSRGFVGQQLLYDIRILRRHDVAGLSWERAPSFPSFRAEWLPGLAEDGEVEREGVRYRLFHERRALFPAQPGVLEIPPAAFLCASGEAEQVVPVPGTRVRIEAIPETGRPADYSGLVGPVELSASLSPQRLSLGGSARLSLVLRGTANVWDAASPLPAGTLPAHVESFARPSELARDAGRRFAARRYFAYDLVPREPGTLRIPALRITSFDPRSRRFQVSTTRPFEVIVDPAAPAASDGPRIPELPSEPSAGSETLPVEPTGPLAPGRGLGLLLVVGAGLLGLLGLRELFRHRQRGAPLREAVRSLAEVEAPDAPSPPGETVAQALRLALGRHIAGAGALASEELLECAAGDPELEAAAQLLLRVDRARFEPDADAPDPAEARHCIEALGRRR